jgi:hypothetical protein
MVSNVEPRLFIPCVTAGIINGIVAKGKQKIPHILSDPPSVVFRPDARLSGSYFVLNIDVI